MTSDTEAPDDLDLLQIEITVRWDTDDRRRLHGPHHLVIAATPSGMAATVASSLPDDLADQLLEVVRRAAPPQTLTQPPAAIHECRALLSAAAPGQLDLFGGPSYLASPPMRYGGPPTRHGGSVAVMRSERPDVSRVRRARPDNWAANEWHELLNGGKGAPWAMVVDDGRVVSMCHTPRISSAGAEAGTWTDPKFRGRGYAAAATAAWADLLAATSPFLFYSTTADNRSSQRVAERLGLRQIGWLWKLSRTTRA